MIDTWWFRLALLAIVGFGFYFVARDGTSADDYKLFIALAVAVAFVGGVAKRGDIMALLQKKIVIGSQDKPEDKKDA